MALSRKRFTILLLSILLIILSWQQVLAANRGLVVREMTRDGVPLRFIAPANVQNAPAILVAHGFAGSKQLMLAYGYTFAHAGYGVMLLDFGGHGDNPSRLDRAAGTLQADLDVAFAALREQPEVNETRVALLGHSMGSGAVLDAGVRDVGRYAATVAISPREVEVTSSAPRNLLLQAGALEPPFAESARRLLDAAGGPNDDLAGGLARALVMIPGAEHITILFRWRSHTAALDWLNQTFGLETAAHYRDARILWYGVHLVSWLVGLTAVAPLLPAAPRPPAKQKRKLWSWLGLLVGPLLATGLIVLVSQAVNLSRVGGLLVGGAMGVWFFIMGSFWLATGFRLPRLTPRAVLWGLALFAILWLAFGALAHLVWLPWVLIPTRLARWPFLALLLLPWLLAGGLAQAGAGRGRRLAWWLAQSVLLLVGLGAAVVLVPELSFLFLILPILPIILGILSVAGAAVDQPWAYAIGSALFFAWVVAAVFPLA